MIYTISNQNLSVSIDTLGAQLRSVKAADGVELLWQGDERYWPDSSPVLFPYIARLFDKSYTYLGQRYSMGIHGFAAQCEFEAVTVGAESVTMRLRENEATLAQYPFPFSFSIVYSLSGSELSVTYIVENMGDKAMPFAVGGHPGFNVPRFEDAQLVFDRACKPLRIGFTGELFLSGEDRPYPLKDGRILPLSHSLFDEDAIILKDCTRAVSLCCPALGKKLHMSFPGFDYFGIWHKPCTDAPYVCLEPWSSLPSRQGVIEELTEKPDMIILPPGQRHELSWTLSVCDM
jgi:galactose mutarotase-like enzyme